MVILDEYLSFFFKQFYLRAVHICLWKLFEDADLRTEGPQEMPCI